MAGSTDISSQAADSLRAEQPSTLQYMVYNGDTA